MAALSKASSLTDVVGFVIGIINSIIPVLVTLALVLFMYAGYRYVAKAQETKGKGAEREALMWGVIALFVIVMVWGILRIMCSSLIGTSDCRSVGHPDVQLGGLY